MEACLKRTWAEIHLDRLEENIRLLRSCPGAEKELMAVVKADAYGHGDRVIARELCRLGIQCFAVSNIEEAVSLRRADIKGDILILGATPAECAGLLAANDLSQAVFSAAYAAALDAAARAACVRVKCHLKLDTGMGRIGFISSPEAEEAEALLEAAGRRNLLVEGIFSHFSVADALDTDSCVYTDTQQACFDRTVRMLQKNGISFKYVHLQNSAGIMRQPDTLCNLMRMGIAMYGLAPSGEMDGMLPLKPLMELKTVISMVKEVPAGTSVSYGRTYISDRPVRVATVPIGYADGYHRALSGKGYMLVHGRRADILGRVCMDQLMLDVTGIPEAQEGDTVTVFGESEGAFLPVDTLAALAGTISYELVCAVSRRVPRIYYRGGEQLDIVDYLSEPGNSYLRN